MLLYFKFKKKCKLPKPSSYFSFLQTPFSSFYKHKLILPQQLGLQLPQTALLQPHPQQQLQRDYQQLLRHLLALKIVIFIIL